MSVLRIATRQSPLALWQAEHVAGLLQAQGQHTELVPMTTAGDRWLESPLEGLGGKSLFVKELEAALLEGRADIAVHSMKDVPSALPHGLCLDVVLASEDPRDALVAAKELSLETLPPKARVGTASLRRQALLRARRPDLQVEALRGNVGTRLARLDQGDFQALLLACAGLQRLGLSARIAQALPVSEFLPAVGQGVIGIECRTVDRTTRELLAALHHAPTGARVLAERAFNAALGGSCRLPIGGHATVDGSALHLQGMVATVDGSTVLTDSLSGPTTAAADLGRQLADKLMAKGAGDILQQVQAEG